MELASKVAPVMEPKFNWFWTASLKFDCVKLLRFVVIRMLEVDSVGVV